MLPSGSEERTPLAATGSGAIPKFGTRVSTATGAWFTGAVAVTVAAAEPVAPRLSVTMTRTVQVPAANVCVAVAPACGPTTVPSPKSNRYEAMVPSASDEADAFAVTLSGAGPLEGETVSRATGAWFAGVDAVTVASAEPVAPWLSVTVTRTVHVPAANVWVAVASACGPMMVPSLKSNRYEAMVPSVSEEAEALAVTLSGAVPLEGVTVSRATGGWLPAAVTVTVAAAVPVAP